jgi:uncharacterized protein
MHPITRQTAVAVLVVVAGGLSGCAALFDTDSAPIDYYVLSAAPTSAAPVAASGPIFGIAPVRVPQYLSQKAIVTRTGENALALAANDQWAAPLSDTIAAVVSENLTTMIPSARVVELPVSSAVPIDYEIHVEVVTFERQPNAAVDLVARWSVFTEGGRQLLTMTRSAYRVPNVADDYADITAAMSTLLAELSRDIAATLRAAATPIHPTS